MNEKVHEREENTGQKSLTFYAVRISQIWKMLKFMSIRLIITDSTLPLYNMMMYVPLSMS